MSRKTLKYPGFPVFSMPALPNARPRTVRRRVSRELCEMFMLRREILAFLCISQKYISLVDFYYTISYF